jgi:hypothetical protein
MPFVITCRGWKEEKTLKKDPGCNSSIKKIKGECV